MNETEVRVDIAGNSLAGSVCLPADGKGRYPMLLFVHGSGPLDRDENTLGMKLNVFNTMAHRLAESGIGSLRFDKRGCANSTGDYITAGHHDLVEDVEGMLNYLQAQRYCAPRQVFLLGHSEGAIIAPQVAVAHKELAGIVLLNPFAQALQDVLLAQARQMQQDIGRLGVIKGKLVRLLTVLLGSPEVQQAGLIARIRNSDTPVIRYKLRKINARWFRELFDLDIEAIYRGVPCPALVIGGTRDIQCDPADVAQIGEWMGHRADTQVVEKLSHILREEPGTPSLFNYRKLMKQEIDLRVLTLVEQWLLKIIDTARRS